MRLLGLLTFLELEAGIEWELVREAQPLTGAVDSCWFQQKTIKVWLLQHRPSESTSLGPRGSQRLKHQPESMQGLDLGPCTYVADTLRGLHVGPVTTGAGASLTQTLLPTFGSISPAGLLCLASVGNHASLDTT